MAQQRRKSPKQAKPGHDDVLWQFAQQLYRQAEVEPACLLLQQRYDVDISLLMFILWLVSEGYEPLDAHAIIDYRDQMHHWRETIILPLREIRDTLKPIANNGHAPINQLRKSVLACELEAERIELMMLSETLQYLPPPTTTLMEEKKQRLSRVIAALCEAYGINEYDVIRRTIPVITDALASLSH